ncbi:indolepyruvate ferredoxin oxidoreductase family protein [Ciceribacter sp. RN22]|uniref:indolepyruvate ferredoxin oxidoreductase family protein n=1 Tax=Ciceribacter sp. RN22 TaxID=2954932 RepID=UPI002093C107|nr:indolepyruvate ferredoxin oxidoreductase family protein [Ciceribacter sp. RN22]MCO6179377.1 indolepyruvate ferredoxin oxidoreductase family protein [Ciceribacter sp. RN22]
MNVVTALPTASDINREYKLDDCYDGQDVFLTGTQALVRLPLEQARLDRAAGLNTAGFITGYRGSPLAAYDSALMSAHKRLQQAGVTFKPAVNEDLAATALFGTQEVSTDPQRTRDGVFGIWYGKGPGVDRAGDALKHGNAFGASEKGGVLALLGDDHGCVSSSMPHQSDHALASFMMPVIHPAMVGDYIPFGLFAIAASRFSGAWVGMKTISEVLESGATVTVDRDVSFKVPADYRFPRSGLGYDPTKCFGPVMERRMLERLDAFRAFAKANPIDRHAFGAPEPQLAIIAVGKAFLDVMDALAGLGIPEANAIRLGLGVYKVGLAWPIEPSGFSAFLVKAKKVLVVEEKRDLVETQLRALLFGREKPLQMMGKRDASRGALLPEAGELRPALVAEALISAFGLNALVSKTDNTRAATAQLPELVVQKRAPFFCSGCPHNRSTKVPEGAEAFAGIGCHFMANWMPRNTTGLVQMGGEGVNWIGRSLYSGREHMFQNLGDGTYFHSGLMAIRAAVAAGVNITYKILYNDAVAMTGGQPIDGSLSVEDIVTQLRGEGVRRIAVVSENPSRFGKAFRGMSGVTLSPRDELMAIQNELQSTTGVTAIIYDQGCAAEKRRKRKRAMIADPGKRVFINEAVCEGCGDCSAKSNCVSIVPVKTAWGVQRQIDQSSCNKDFSCADGFCPSFVTVSGVELKEAGDSKRRTALLARAERLPVPAVPETGEVVICGIGGTGVVTIGAVLAMAAHLEGKGSTLLDFTGFAQKGGAVVSHLKVAKTRMQSRPARVGQGSASALIASDMIVATMPDVFAILSEHRTCTVVSTNVTPTGDFVSQGIFDFEEGKRLKALRGKSRSLHEIRANTVAVRLFGDSVYANMLLAGYAWQKGLLPLSLQAVERAIELNGQAVGANLDAFKLGRLHAEMPEAFEDERGRTEPVAESLDELIASRAAFLTDYQDTAYAADFTAFIEKVRRAEAPLGADELARTVASNLSRLMAYKDEYEVARLHLESPALANARQRFTPGAKVSFHMAPPLLSFIRSTDGKPRKIAIPGRIALPVLRLLRLMRPLRGTVFDPFGFTRERREERRLVSEYRHFVEDLLPGLSAASHHDAVEAAGLADMIRGFGHVKAGAIDRYRLELRALTDRQTAGAPGRAA